MQFYISPKTRRVVVNFSEGMKGSNIGSTRGLQRCRSIVFRTVLVIAALLPFVFIRASFLALEGASKCSSIHCLGWRFGPRFLTASGSSLALADELTRAAMEARNEAVDDGWDGPEAFGDLVVEVIAKKNDIKTFVFKAKAMISKMDRKFRTAKLHESINRHFASMGIPRSIHCLSLRLAEEYSINAAARSPLPLPESVTTLINNSYYHFVLLTDNVLAASVVVSSAVENSRSPEKIVFHVVTDKKTYAPMHAWFALNPVFPAAIEVKGLHQFDWPMEMNVEVLEILGIHRAIREFHYRGGAGKSWDDSGDVAGKLDAGNPNYLSILNHLRIYLPQLFPELDKIVFLDDDVVVQHDLTQLWAVDLDGKVNGAVEAGCDGNLKHHHIPAKFGNYLNFSNPLISSQFDPERCAWAYGMNIFDLQAWRMANITEIYHHWLKLNLESGLILWRLGTLPPALIAFYGHVQAIDNRWHVSGMGYQWRVFDLEKLHAAAVVHYSGPSKPWLEIGVPELRSLWSRHVNFSNEFMRECRILE